MNRDVREIVREEPLHRDEILAALGEGPRTVGEIAAAIGADERETMFWVMGMRKYGRLTDLDTSPAGYVRFEAVAG
jgi:predicted Rossmann fold nucleotide-binding protein DprA/Smf involved in DNA uptake